MHVYSTIKKDTKFGRALRKYGADNFTYEILFTLEESDDMNYIKSILNEKETFYVSEYDSYNNGYNCTKGGDGTIGCKLSPEHIQILRELRLGKPRSQETKDRISKSLTGRKMSEQARINIGKGHKGLRHSEEARKNMSIAKQGTAPTREAVEKSAEVRRVRIYQYTKQMEFIQEWASIKEASTTLHVDNTNISLVCSGKRKSAGGFV